LNKYYSFEYIKKAPILVLNKLLIGALKQKNEERFWNLYIAIYPNMDENSFLTFEQFKNKITKNTHEEEEIKRNREIKISKTIEIAERIRKRDENNISK
jgi:hypothetical protein